MTYRKHTLTEMSCQAPRVNDPDRLRQLEMWFAEARAAGVRVPEAMAVATATPHGAPSVRMVLLKEVAHPAGPPGLLLGGG
jgi:pyridoxine/pyridoxamine 5'-phosphate oxidase